MGATHRLAAQCNVGPEHISTVQGRGSSLPRHGIREADREQEYARHLLRQPDQQEVRGVEGETDQFVFVPVLKDVLQPRLVRIEVQIGAGSLPRVVVPATDWLLRRERLLSAVSQPLWKFRAGASDT